MVRVLFIGKYPPIQGGTATTSFWLHKELAKRGITFEVVTIVPCDSEFVINSCMKSENVHWLNVKTPWHIPYSQLYSEQLISKALEIASVKEFDIIESNYLFPYGFAAYVVSTILKKPLMLRHAGSDLYRVTNNSMFAPLLKEMATYAKAIVTNSESVRRWENICNIANVFVTSRYVPNPEYFNLEGCHDKVVFIGKVTEKWDRKQLDFYYEYLCKNKHIGKINVFSNEYTIDVFKKYFSSTFYEIVGNPFVMPCDVPKILSGTKYLLVSKIPSGIPEESNTYLEGLVAGCIPVCIDNKMVTAQNMNFNNYIKSQCEIYKEIMS